MSPSRTLSRRSGTTKSGGSALPMSTPRIGRDSPPFQRDPANRRWRDYETASGRRPVKDFIAELTDDETAAVVAMAGVYGERRTVPHREIRLAERRGT